MNLIISSTGLDAEKVRDSFIEMLPNQKKLKAIIITTACSYYKEKNKYARSTQKIFASLGISTSFIDIEFENPEILLKADIIYINGGNPYYLLHHIYKSKADLVLKK